jgi:hypothetical protein
MNWTRGTWGRKRAQQFAAPIFAGGTGEGIPRAGGLARAGVLAVAWLATACGSDDASQPPQDAQIAPDSSQDAQIAQPACVERLPCSFRPITGEPSDPIQIQLGCGPTYEYVSSSPLNAWSGIGSFCPDSPANRDMLRDSGKFGYLSGFCDTCLGVPEDKIFVFWKHSGPNCPSSCGPMPF